MIRCHDDPADPGPSTCTVLAMPGKSQQGGRGKQESSKERLNSASQRYNESKGSFDCLIIPLMLDNLLNFSETVRKPTIWPEWTEAELAAEKWDLGGGKSRAKSSANNVVSSSQLHIILQSSHSAPHLQLFEDTEGILLPPSLLAAGNVVWKRVSNPVVLSTLGDEVGILILKSV